jgi:hypothetical protein
VTTAEPESISIWAERAQPRIVAIGP